MSEQDVLSVMSILGCTEDEAHKYLSEAGGDPLKAIEQNLNIPVTSGNKYIPPPPVIDDGLTDEVREKLKEARKISEMFNASFRNDLIVKSEKKATSPAAEAAPEELEEGELPELAQDAAQG
jgi:hypothetical protein